MILNRHESGRLFDSEKGGFNDKIIAFIVVKPTFAIDGSVAHCRHRLTTRFRRCDFIPFVFTVLALGLSVCVCAKNNVAA